LGFSANENSAEGSESGVRPAVDAPLSPRLSRKACIKSAKKADELFVRNRQEGYGVEEIYE